jgi:hypothetical protein
MDDLLKALGKTARDDRARPFDGDEADAAAPLDERTREAMVDAALQALIAPLEAPSSEPAPGLPAQRPDAIAARADRPEGGNAADVAPASAAPAPLRVVAGARHEAASKGASAATPAAPRGMVARLTRMHFGATAALAVAASIAFLLVFRSEGPSGDGLPPYSLSLSGSTSELRGEPSAPSAVAKVRPNATLTLVLRPEAPVNRPLEARVFVEQGGALKRVDVPVEVSPEGALRLVARVDRLFVPPSGSHRLIVAVGPQGALPDATSLEALRRAPSVRVSEALVSVDPP